MLARYVLILSTILMGARCGYATESTPVPVSTVPVSKADDLPVLKLPNFKKREKLQIMIPGKPFIRKMGKHLGRDIQECVTLYVKENCNSDKLIERTGILTIRPHARAIILICHGFMCNKHDTGFLRFLFKDYHVMTFDFRAHGEKSEDQCCTFGKDEMNDVIAAVQYLRQHKELRKLPLIVYGFSMGAVASILAQSSHPGLFDAMILDCPFDSTDNIIQRGIDKLKISVWGYEVALPGSSFLKEYAYTPYVQSLLKFFFKAVAKMDSTQINSCMQPISTIDAIKKINVPTLFIGCVNDEKVPPRALINIYNAAGSKIKKLWITDGVRHYDSFFYNPELYYYELTDFIKKFLRKKFARLGEQKIIYDKPEWEAELAKAEIKIPAAADTKLEKVGKPAAVAAVGTETKLEKVDKQAVKAPVAAVDAKFDKIEKPPAKAGAA